MATVWCMDLDNSFSKLTQFIPSSLIRLPMLLFWSSSAPTCCVTKGSSSFSLGSHLSTRTCHSCLGSLNQPRHCFLESHWQAHHLRAEMVAFSSLHLRPCTAQCSAMILVLYLLHSFILHFLLFFLSSTKLWVLWLQELCLLQELNKYCLSSSINIYRMKSLLTKFFWFLSFSHFILLLLVFIERWKRPVFNSVGCEPRLPEFKS